MFNSNSVIINRLNVGGAGYNNQSNSHYNNNRHSDIYYNNGGYYNNQNYGVYNPYLQQQQLQLQQQQQQQEQQRLTGISKLVSRQINKALGKDEEYIQMKQQIYNPKANVENNYDPNDNHRCYTTEQLSQFHYGYEGNMIVDNTINRVNTYIEQSQPQGEVTMENFGDFMYTEMQQIDTHAIDMKRRNLTGLYNSSHYKQLIGNSNGGGGYFNSLGGGNARQVGGNINLDDMSVKLPNSIDQEIIARKQQFFNTLRSGNVYKG